MSAGLRPVITAGVALVGASVIAATPVTPPQPEIGVSNSAVSLAAAATPFAAAAEGSNIANVPANLFNAIVNIPAAEIAGLNLFAKSLEETGSLLVWSPTNVFGFDQADPDKLQSVIDLLVPFPALSSVIGAQSVIWAQANLPVNPGCAALPGACPDPAAILGELFGVPTSQLYEGYTFPKRVNPFDGSDVGYPDGYVKLDPNAPAQSFMDYLLAPPTGVQAVTLEQVGATVARLGAALFNSFYPFVQNSEYYNPDETGLAYVFRALSPILCANCNRDPADGYAGVYQPEFLYDNYDPHFPPSTEPSAQTATTNPSTPAAGDALQKTADVGNKPATFTATVSDDVAGTVSDDVAGTVSDDVTGTATDATTAVTKPESTNTPATNVVTSDGNMVVPGQSGATRRKPGVGPASDLQSLQDKVDSSISKVTDGSMAGTAPTAGAAGAARTAATAGAAGAAGTASTN